MKRRPLLKKIAVFLIFIIGIDVIVTYLHPVITIYSISENVVVKTEIINTLLLNGKLDDEQTGLPQNFDVPLQSEITARQIIDILKRGGLSVYQWRGICTDELDVLKAYPGFPMFPDSKSSALSSNINLNIESFGMRIFGYLIPETTGEYEFKIVSETASSELWLSTGIQPNKLKLLISNNSSNSDSILLQGGNPYFIEILSVSSGNLDKLTLYWCPPNRKEYKEIVQKFLAQYPTDIEENIQRFPSHITQFQPNTLHDPREIFPLLHQLPTEMYPNIFPNCSDLSSKLIPKEVITFKGLWSLFETEIFLYNMSTHEILNEIQRINETEANKIIQTFKVANENNPLLGFTLLNLEKSIDEVREDRYLLEGKVNLQNRSYLLTQTLHDVNGILCVPTLTPNLTAFVHIVIIVKDLRRWMRYFLENVNNIYTQTNDQQFGVIIVDFNSGDLNIRDTMQQNLKIQRYMYIPMEGKFNKVLGQNKAIESINNPNDIIFTCDLHLDIPINMIDIIRKHTIQGISLFAPMLRRLNCGVLSFLGPGMWETSGYGLIAMFKSDWEFVGGMSNEFGLRWGGEDWELVDRLLRVGYHIYRVRVPALVHYYHTREGAWYIGS